MQNHKGLILKTFAVQFGVCIITKWFRNGPVAYIVVKV